MKELPDKSIDMVLTDPPYGIGESNERNATRGKGGFTSKAKCAVTDFGHYEWDKDKVSDEHMMEIKRVSKNQIIFGGNYYGSILGDTSCYVVWDKDNGDCDFADCELAWTSFKTAVRKIKWRWNGMLQEDMKHKEIRFHPTQKPVPVMSWIIANYSQPNALILDPFLGSGTTAVAAIKTGRRFIGIEISQAYVDIANKRINAELAQLKLPLTYE
jgi:site-specific DNA-methyltransferase (adenine-specific)